MRWKNNLLMGGVISLVVIVFSAKAMAVPSYGVATNATYFGQGASVFEPYQDFFAADFVSGGGSDPEHGFGIDSGSTSVLLTVFTNELDTEAWLMAESNFANNDLGNDIGGTFGADPFSGDQIDGYTARPYLALSLGAVRTGGVINAGWTALPDPPFPDTPDNGYYARTVEITFGNALTDDDLFHYFFAAGNVNRDGIIDPDISGGEFSPKTTSSQVVNAPVPEPATIALLGIGLAGLAGVEVRRRRKKKAVNKS